ncbi:MAG: hypothetical protein DWH71_04420 [Planctomycetota bacterium]|nr:MAG: hypothetical protein DWH71_04420 [Planctomycetota bacterium]
MTMKRAHTAFHTKRSLTRIVATVGPVSNSAAMLTRLARAGVSVFRLNMSHGDPSPSHSSWKSASWLTCPVQRFDSPRSSAVKPSDSATETPSASRAAPE